MKDSHKNHASLSLTPLGAGDLIDRAVRFYRNNFWTFVWIAAPPILFGTMISIGWTAFGRDFLGINLSNSGERFLYTFFTAVGNLTIWFFEAITTLMVMGGASRNFVRHILFGEPITFRETYSNVRSRLGGLLGASLITASLLSFIGLTIFYMALFILVFAIALIAVGLSFAPPFAVILSIVLGGAVIFGAVWLFFLIASRFAYVQQIMLVEGQSVFSAIGRSTSLAKGNVRRLIALFFFTILATYSALLLFYVPLGWYAWTAGLQIFTADPDAIPAWFLIAAQVVSQASLILLMPVWMIGLCLLYVDERVRHEGYDIELMAARNLGEIPALPRQYVSPLQPALSTEPVLSPPPVFESGKKNSTSVLGLD